jgi:ABC-type sugar transport system ATPase subunit
LKTQIDNTISAKVVLVEQLGRETLIKVLIGDNKNDTNFIRILRPTTMNFSYNEPVYLKLDADAIHIFDFESGRILTEGSLPR